MSKVIHINASEFDEKVKNSSQPVIVDFWAEWCGPCKMIAPILDEVSLERPHVTIAKVDVDANTELAQKFRVRGIPTMILFKDGKEIAVKSGALTKTQLNAWLDNSLE